MPFGNSQVRALQRRLGVLRRCVGCGDVRGGDFDPLLRRAELRLRPGQLPPLLDLLGVGDLVVAADGDRSRSGEAPAGDVARLLGPLRGAAAYGPSLPARPTPTPWRS